MAPTGGHNRIEAIIQQVLDLMDFSGNTTEELSEDQLDLVAAAISAPDYQQFIRKMGEKGRDNYGTKEER